MVHIKCIYTVTWWHTHCVKHVYIHINGNLHTLRSNVFVDMIVCTRHVFENILPNEQVNPVTRNHRRSLNVIRVICQSYISNNDFLLTCIEIYCQLSVSLWHNRRKAPHNIILYSLKNVSWNHCLVSFQSMIMIISARLYWNCLFNRFSQHI